MKIMITGHRPSKLGGYGTNPIRTKINNWMHTTLTECKKKWPNIEVISGMALGVDQWWAHQARLLQIPFHAYVPFKGQEGRWPQ